MIWLHEALLRLFPSFLALLFGITIFCGINVPGVEVEVNPNPCLISMQVAVLPPEYHNFSAKNMIQNGSGVSEI